MYASQHANAQPAMYKETHTEPYHNLLGGLIAAVVPEPIVNPEPNQLQWWLRPKRVLGRHVEIVHEGDELLAANGNVHSLGSLLHTTLNDVLYVVGGGLVVTGYKGRNNTDVKKKKKKTTHTQKSMGTLF